MVHIATLMASTQSVALYHYDILRLDYGALGLIW